MQFFLLGNFNQIFWDPEHVRAFNLSNDQLCVCDIIWAIIENIQNEHIIQDINNAAYS